MGIVTGDAIEVAGALLVAAADGEADGSKANAEGVFELGGGTCVLLHGRTVAGGAGGDGTVATDGGLLRVAGLGPVAAFAVDAGAVARLMAGEAAVGVVGALADAEGRLKRGGGLEGVARGEAELVGGRVPGEALLDPGALVAEDRSAGEVAGAEEPLDGEEAGLSFAGDGEAAGVERVSGAVAFVDLFAGKAGAVVGTEGLGVAALELFGDAIGVAGGAGEGYCGSENKSCCADNSRAAKRLTAAKARVESALRPSWL